MSDFTEKKKVKFLTKLATGASVTAAAKTAGIARGHVYALREKDALFAEAWEDALEQGTDNLEDTALRFANKGDSTLIKFLLGARRPEKYRERKDINLSGGFSVVSALDELDDPDDSTE